MKYRSNSRFQRSVAFWLQAFRPITLLISLGFGMVYKVFFSWWLGPIWDHQMQKSVAENIKQAAPYLFLQHGGTVVPDPRPEANSRALANLCVATTNLFFRFSTWRMENLWIRIAPAFAPNDSYDSIDALRALGRGAQPELPANVVSWHQFGLLLGPRFRDLEVAFSQENFADTKRKIALVQVGKLPV